ncbi:unnamed protein product [Durusdinium trenchii]|uniref:Uncharacterized protein n=2 Tax=Durusdinium trenchii TaxID=1381693 RepID=A0ABP0IPM9_9DINO
MSSAETDEDADAEFAAECKQLRLYYKVVGREEWWWVMDNSIDAIGAQLNKQGYCIIDDFLTSEQAKQLRKEVVECHSAGRLAGGGLVNGQLPSPDDAKYADRASRGDVIGWFDPEEWPHGKGLESYLVKLGTLIQELSRPVPDLLKVTSRSKAMAACYPGGGARYIKHVDNDGKHHLCRTRLLTALIYLNGDWQVGDGGELAIFQHENQTALRRTVAPLQNRLLLFWSDRRTPHEVLPSEKPRYSVTVWLLDNTKKVNFEASDPPQAPSVSLQAGHDASQKATYSWQSEPDGWTLQVQLLDRSDGCPLLEVSDAQIRIARTMGQPLLCVPVPTSCEAPVPRWSRKKSLLTLKFSTRDGLPSELDTFAEQLATQLASRGWGVLDGFLPGPQADDLRNFVLAEKAAGKLHFGKNKHEGPVNCEAKPMKNDTYTFLDTGEVPECLREMTGLCNRLLAKLLVSNQLKGLEGKNLWQGHPMLAVYPGNGSAYGRHLDSTAGGRGGNGRVLTLVLYLNPFWQESDGGCLRILKELADTSGTEIEPLHGRLVGFFCEDQNPHEVLPCWSDRVAVTIWYYDGDRLSKRCAGDESNLVGVFEGG